MTSKSRSQLERDLERKCVELADIEGWLNVKLDRAARGWPDRAFFGYAGVVWLVEFKLPGERPRPQQAALHRRLLDRGHPVSVVQSVEQFEQSLRLFAELRQTPTEPR